MKSMSSHKTESQLFNTYSSWESSLDNNRHHMVSSSLRGRRLKGKGEGVLGAR